MQSAADRPDLDDSDDDFEDSDDDSEIERELEERMRQAQLDGRDKIFEDVSDATSEMSMMSNTMTGMNFIPVDTDLDNLIDHLIQN